MDKFLAQPESTRAEAIKEAATRMQLHPTPVEKDFWVCYSYANSSNSNASKTTSFSKAAHH